MRIEVNKFICQKHFLCRQCYV